MKKIASFLAAAAVWVLTSAMPATAILIDFSEVATNTADPTIGSVSFFAGNPASWNDTFVTDAWTPGNNYLLSGKNDGTNFPKTPSSFETDYIGAALNLAGQRFNTVTFDLAVEEILPGNTNQIAYGFWNGTNGIVTIENFVWDEDNNYRNYRTLSVSNTSNYDYFLIMSYNLTQMDNTEPFTFHIDNFNYTTKPIDGNPVVPEPSTFALLGLGLAGAVLLRRRIVK